MPKKEFEAFTRLDASDVNTFLMDQSVMTFGSATARDAAIDTPVEGQVTYLTDIDSLTVYNGTQWVTNRPVMNFAGTAARGSAIPSPVEGMVSFLEDSNIMSIYDGSAWQSSVNTTGGILQVVSTAKTDTFTMSSSTFADVTGLTATITPKSSTSKILVMLDIKLAANTTLVTQIQLRLRRAGTDIYLGDAAGIRTQTSFSGAVVTGGFMITQGSSTFLDSPATTSATTYSIGIRTSDNTRSIFVNRGFNDEDDPTRSRTASSLTLMEVSA